MIKITGIHKYIVQNPFPDKALPVPISIYSGLGRGKFAKGGFKYVKIGDRRFLKENLDAQISINAEQTTKCFKFHLSIPIGKTETFEYHTYGIYRLDELFVWTFQEMSDNIKLSVKNDTDYEKTFIYKINHHNCEEIENGRIDRSQKNFDTIDFREFIFPYQGFEISWDFKAKTGK